MAHRAEPEKHRPGVAVDLILEDDLQMIWALSFLRPRKKVCEEPSAAAGRDGNGSETGSTPEPSVK